MSYSEIEGYVKEYGLENGRMMIISKQSISNLKNRKWCLK